jgi:hypothetical protein
MKTRSKKRALEGIHDREAVGGSCAPGGLRALFFKEVLENK